MAPKRVNILVYAGTGSTIASVRHAIFTLRRLLGSNYAVLSVSEEAILKEPWSASCALLVMPGGGDLGYCRILNGAGNRRISQYVNRGGAYLGLCAGGYYGSSRCEFEVGNRPLEVIGERELGFFPGVCRGLAFPGFQYNSEAGAHAAELKVNKDTLSAASRGSLADTFRCYYNGGGVFVDAEKLADRGVEVLASYTQKLHVDSGQGRAAVVYRKIGEGAALLCNPHPEFAGSNLNRRNGGEDYAKVVEALVADDQFRTDFFKACLSKLGLKVSEDEVPVPSLSRLHLCSATPSDVSNLVSSWSDIITLRNNEEHIVGQHDTFYLEKQSGSTFSMDALSSAVSEAAEAVTNTLTVPLSSDDKKTQDDGPSGPSTPGEPNYDTIPKRIVLQETSLPTPKETPHFNIPAYYAHLSEFLPPAIRLSRQNNEDVDDEKPFGHHLLYGEVVTSTNTLLETNSLLSSRLPHGFTFTATTQIAGRGRGSNVWVSPPGSLMFSTVIHHSMDLATTNAPVVFIQYLAALAIVQGLQTYGPGYDLIPVRLKWPNDIYVLDPSSASTLSPSTRTTNAALTEKERNAFVKIGGILVNSSYTAGTFTLIVGIGLNVSNPGPTTSLNAVAREYRLKEFELERLLPSIVTSFDETYRRFCVHGFKGGLLREYYRAWLHGGQRITLDPSSVTSGSGTGASHPARDKEVIARITGITEDYGLLVAEEVVPSQTGGSGEYRTTGTKWELQSDANSFDFFRGLIRRKI